ncbi:MAG: NAD(P)/FAD-dependent oxidoreductase, partial [Actinobacteria bacterium]|nr:NAD(P)/FAD-dependent oxidoreductase [Actinomycetota bacterium]
IEGQATPGGYASPLEKKDYSFYFPQLMTGCSFGGNITRILEHLEINLELVKIDPCYRYIFPDKDLPVPSSLEEFKNILKDEFQPQTSNLNAFFDYVARVHKENKPKVSMRSGKAPEILGLFLFSILSPFNYFQTLGSSTASRLLSRYFNDINLASILAAPWPKLGSPPWLLSSQRLIFHMMNLSNGAYIPAGGYGELVDSLEKSVKHNGGEILYSQEITRVSVDRGRVVEVATGNGGRFSTGNFINDMDTLKTFSDILGNEEKESRFQAKVRNQTTSISGFVVFLGINKKLEKDDLDFGTAFVYPSYDHMEMYQQITNDREYPEPDRMPFLLSVPSMFCSSCAPEGKTAVCITVPAVPYSFMDGWGGSAGRSRDTIKERYAEIAVSAVSSKFPDLISDVEAYEAVTPADFERMVMSTGGCWYDVAPEPKQSYFNRMGPKTPIKGLYLTGSKSFLGGGIHSSMLGGLLAANSVLRIRIVD